MASYIHPRHAIKVGLSTAITAASVGALFSRYEAVKIVGLTVLTAASLNFFNNLFSYHDCPDYFVMSDRLSKKKEDKRLIRSSNLVINAGVWALYSQVLTWIPGVLLAIVARAPFSKFKYQVSARQLAPWMVASAAIIFVIAHFKARRAQSCLKNRIDYESDIESRKKYEGVHKNSQAGYEACTVRVAVSLKGAGLVGVVGIIGMFVSRLGLIKIPSR